MNETMNITGKNAVELSKKVEEMRKQNYTVIGNEIMKDENGNLVVTMAPLIAGMAKRISAKEYIAKYNPTVVERISKKSKNEILEISIDNDLIVHHMSVVTLKKADVEAESLNTMFCLK